MNVGTLHKVLCTLVISILFMPCFSSGLFPTHPLSLRLPVFLEAFLAVGFSRGFVGLVD